MAGGACSISGVAARTCICRHWPRVKCSGTTHGVGYLSSCRPCREEAQICNQKRARQATQAWEPPRPLFPARMAGAEHGGAGGSARASGLVAAMRVLGCGRGWARMGAPVPVPVPVPLKHQGRRWLRTDVWLAADGHAHVARLSVSLLTGLKPSFQAQGPRPQRASHARCPSHICICICPLRCSLLFCLPHRCHLSLSLFPLRLLSYQSTPRLVPFSSPVAYTHASLTRSRGWNCSST